MLAFLEVGGGASHRAPTVDVVPVSWSTAVRLADGLREVTDHVEQPVTVWWWDVRLAVERLGTMYGWGLCDGARCALVVTRARAGDGDRLFDDVRWVPAVFVRARTDR